MTLSALRTHLQLPYLLSLLALVTSCVIGWLFLIASETAMRDMAGHDAMMTLMWAMMRPADSLPYLGATGLMWMIMMMAMMVPAVIPMFVVFNKLERKEKHTYDSLIFASGYLIAWLLFSVVAAVCQWFLHRAGWLHGHEMLLAPSIAAGVLIAAGIYQITPFKEACLNRCRSPMGFFLANMREGRLGALQMGLHHGLFCIGCCWMLMLIMFVGGVMSVVTMILLSIFILAERLLPPGPWVSRIPGIALIAWGIYVSV